MDNQFILQDRIQKIRSIISKYGEENFFISFSGGKDSCVLDKLIDIALPDNKIPRVYVNTGIEYRYMVEYVKDRQKNDNRIVIIKPNIPIKTMLNQYGYPFKSKVHSGMVDRYNRLGNTKSVLVYRGLHEKKWSSINTCPKKLQYQFTDNCTLKISDKCCVKLKEEPLKNYMKSYGYKYNIIGIRASEGGRRSNAKCLSFRNDKLWSFQPLAVIENEWENWFIKEYNIALCKLYYPPYNFTRTGCKGCPFAIDLQRELDILKDKLPNEYKQCEIIWDRVYSEYRRINYRLKGGKHGI